MAHVINRQEPGPLLWATRLHCLEGHLEQWQLWTPGDTQLVVVSHSEMAHIEPSGQLVRWRLAAQPSAPVGLPTQGIAGMTGEAARQLWLFHLEQARSAAHGQMIEQLLRILVKLNSDSGICEHHFRKVCGQGFFEQKLSFEGRHLFDSLNKPAAKRSAAVVDPRRWNRTVHLTSEYVH